MKKPLWKNTQWAIYENHIDAQYHPESRGRFKINRKRIEDDPIAVFKVLLTAHWASPEKSYQAFLQLATYWDLQCDFDELRKIRDQAKEPAQ